MELYLFRVDSVVVYSFTDFEKVLVALLLLGQLDIGFVGEEEDWESGGVDVFFTEVVVDFVKLVKGVEGLGLRVQHEDQS